jgi:hypothetical protein
MIVERPLGDAPPPTMASTVSPEAVPQEEPGRLSGRPCPGRFPVRSPPAGNLFSHGAPLELNLELTYSRFDERVQVEIGGFMRLALIVYVSPACTRGLYG